MTARPAVNPNNYLKRDGTNTITGNITPDADGTRNFGSASLRFNNMRSEAGTFTGNENAPTRASNGNFSVIGGRSTGPGTNTFQMGGGTYPPVGLLGNVFSYYANQTVSMTHQGGGSFMVGSAFAFYGNNDTAEILCDAGSFGSFTGGYAYPYFGSNGVTIRLRNQASGAFLWAYPAGNGGAATTHECRIYNNAPGAFLVGRSRGAGSAQIHAGGNVGGEGASGGFVQGYVNASNATATGVLRTSGDGAFAQGNVTASTALLTATIDAQASGAFAQGSVSNSASIIASQAGSFAQGNAAGTGGIYASGLGSFAQGRSGSSGTVTASGQGAFAHGRAQAGYSITATAAGAFAVGDSVGASITASAVNAFQLGPGTNAVADSVQVGTDFLAKANGQHAGSFDSLTLAAAATTFAATSNDMIITGDAGANTIATITGGINGQFLCLIFTDANVTITDDNTHAADSIDLSAAFTSADDAVLLLKYDGTSWYEVSRSVN